MLAKIAFRIVIVALVALASGFIIQFDEDVPPEQKRDAVWNRLTTSASSAPWFSLFEQGKIFLSNMDPSFSTRSEWMPAGRQKLIHSVGVVAKARYVVVPNQEKYTGLFQEGSENVIIRLSSATKPVDGRSGETLMTPGIAVKAFRNLWTSANFIAMYSLDGQKSGNFFLNDFSNHVGDATDLQVKLLVKKFESASKYAGKFGLEDLARFRFTDGRWLNRARFPFRLVLKPSPAIRNRVQDNIYHFSADNWMDQFELIGDNEVLYEIWAHNSPRSVAPVHIANLVMNSTFTKTEVGDRELFFRHNRFDTDLKYNPEWRPYVDKELVMQ